MKENKSRKKKSGFGKLMGAISVISIAIIVFAVLWGNGIIGGAPAEDIPWADTHKTSVLSERAGRTGNSSAKARASAFKQEINSFDADAYDDAMIAKLSENLDLERYLAFVDDKHTVNQAYIDEHFPVITVVNDRGQEKQVEELAWYYFRKMKRRLEREEGIIIDLDYGYRSIKGQQEIIDQMTVEHGAEYAWYYASVPGTSEHHTGLAIDVCLIVDGVVIDENEAMNAETEIFSKVHYLMPEYGFVLDFTYEAWHMRFVGSPEIANAYYVGTRNFENFCSWYKQNH